MNIAEALHDAQERLVRAGIEDAHLEAQVLFAHALGVDRAALFARLREPVPPTARNPLESALHRRLAHEPTAYITGRKEFYGLDLVCSPDALIPRPETELLVEYAIDKVRSRHPHILDVGVGSGAISVALAVHLPDARIAAIDSSLPALALARRNAEGHSVAGRFAFIQGDLLTPFRGRFDIIVANLPYIPTSTYEKLSPEIRDHEPRGALHSGRRGTTLIEALLAQAAGVLRQGGLLLAEHAWNQGKRLREAGAAHFPDALIETKRDLAGRERMLVVQTH